ncbi:MAG: Asp-tRNA(Asn)/Glu-tRNA(Gln) amidotransferase GatCAB subunit B, partial [Fluviicola sp.]
ELGLSEYDAGILTDTKAIALYFEDVIKNTSNTKSAANWVMGEIKSYLNQNGLEMSQLPISAQQIAALINLIDSGKVSNTAAAQKLFPALIEDSSKDVSKLAEELNIIIDSNEDDVKNAIQGVLDANPSETERIKNGENQLMGFFMGQIMKATGGKINPKQANEILRELIQK